MGAQMALTASECNNHVPRCQPTFQRISPVRFAFAGPPNDRDVGGAVRQRAPFIRLFAVAGRNNAAVAGPVPAARPMARSEGVAQLGEIAHFLRNACTGALSTVSTERAIPAVAGRRDAFGRDRADARCALERARILALQIAKPDAAPVTFADGVLQGADGLLAFAAYVGISYRHAASVFEKFGTVASRYSQASTASGYFRHHRRVLGISGIAAGRGIP